MGGACRKELEPQLRYGRALSSLRPLDVLLIRSNVDINGFSLDSRIAANIKSATTGTHTPEVVEIPKWDRVALVLPPSTAHPDAYTHDNVMVIEATQGGVKAHTLREVYEGAVELSLRPLKIEAEEQEIKRRKSHWKKKEYVSIVQEGDGGEGSARAKFMLDYLRVSERVVDQPFSLSMALLASMFKWCVTEIAQFTVKDEEKEKVENIVNDECKDNKKEADGITFHQLVNIFGMLARDPNVTNTFSTAQIYSLVSNFNENEGVVNRGEFQQSWEMSARRHNAAQKIPNWGPMLSGGFVSWIFQQIGLLPPEGNFYYPRDFAEAALINRGRKDRHPEKVPLLVSELGLEYTLPPPLPKAAR
jgi:hypothetical protein